MRLQKKFLLVLFLLLIFIPNLSSAQAPDFKVGDKNWKITLVQRALKNLNFAVDRTDGVFTSKTINALKKFQNKNKLVLTGKIDDPTYKLLMQLNKQPNTTAFSLADSLLATAAKYKGVPYKFGGTAADGFDCSGYTSFVFRKHKLFLNRAADDQYLQGRPIAKFELRKGDLVFFAINEKNASHVGIYAGNNSFWHASSSKGVMLSNLDNIYWKKYYLGARRFPGVYS